MNRASAVVAIAAALGVAAFSVVWLLHDRSVTASSGAREIQEKERQEAVASVERLSRELALLAQETARVQLCFADVPSGAELFAPLLTELERMKKSADEYVVTARSDLASDPKGPDAWRLVTSEVNALCDECSALRVKARELEAKLRSKPGQPARPSNAD